jgi:hypothetical protein
LRRRYPHDQVIERLSQKQELNDQG